MVAVVVGNDGGRDNMDTAPDMLRDPAPIVSKQQ